MEKRPKMECPHCGNQDTELIEHNGFPPEHPDLTFLCVAPVSQEDSSFDHLPMDQRPGYCGMQWDPNEAP